MADEVKTPEGFSLKRWSRRKLEAARAPEAAADSPSVPPVAAVPAGSAAPADPAPAPAAVSALPPIESLSIDSDFSVFLQPKVSETLKRQALKKLFGDPHFNVMDGLDVYIDDYSIPDPISADVVRQLVQARYIFDPPQTRINEQGFVEDAPPATAAPQAQAIEGETGVPPPAAEPETGVIRAEAGMPTATQSAAGETAPVDPIDPGNRPRLVDSQEADAHDTDNSIEPPPR